MGYIAENVIRLLAEIPEHVKIVAAAKSRSIDEVREAIEAGIEIVGENYLQDASGIIQELKSSASWHFIGHVQKNKVKHIVPLFDMIETVDSAELAAMIDTIAAKYSKTVSVMIEVNSGREIQKAGTMPEDVPALAEYISRLNNVKLKGLMTMGPFLEDIEGLRPCFKLTKIIFDELKNAAIPGIEMKYLSMGMSDSYRIGIEEGANLVRIGTSIFGSRPPKA
jgi:hypothetical protein